MYGSIGSFLLSSCAIGSILLTSCAIGSLITSCGMGSIIELGMTKNCKNR